MLKAHKRKTRRISGGLASARSVSPRPSLGGQGEAGRRSSGLRQQQQQQQEQQTRAKTAPSSPLSNPADPAPVSSAAQDTWDHKPAPSSQQKSPRDSNSGGGDGSSSSGGGGGGRSEISGPGRQGRGAGTAPATSEPTMGSVFTEWFQKLFAPSEDSKGGGRNGGAGSAPSSSPPGASGAGAGGGRGGGGAGAASAGARAGSSQKASPEADGVRSNKTSVATSDTRPQSPSGAQASSPASAAAKAAASASAQQQQQQQQQAGAGVSAAAPTSGGVAGEGSYFPASGASAGAQQILPGAAAEGSAPVGIPATGKKVDGGGGGGATIAEQQQQQASVSPRFLGIFSRGGGTSGGAGTSSKNGDGSSGSAGAGVDGNPNSAATAGGAASSAAPVTEGGAVGVPASAPAPAPVEAPSFGGGQGPQQQRQPQQQQQQGASVEQQPQPAQAADSGAAVAAGRTGSGAGGAAAAAAGAASEEERAKASALLRRENGSGGSGGGSGSRSSSPQRAAALSVGSDDGEEENLYTAGTHQGARPSIDDFSSLRVLGKGSYGKVVLVRRKSTGVLYAMKILKKGDVVRKRQVERTKIERRVLGNVEHPFLMRLHYAFQTDNKLYLVLDYCPGGELFFHLSRYKRFPEGVVRFYAAELVLALKHLHDNNIIYRDIKPENILLDADGHIKLGDFGLAKDNVSDSTFGAQSVCGTPEYMAPEVINKAGHGTAVDWWGLGMLMYEMLTGLPPWYTKDRQKLFERLRGAPLVIPKNVSAPSASIIGGLLTRNPSKRLGTLGALQVMNHEFFRGLDWAALLAKRIPAPLNPCRNQRQGSESTHNFDPQFTRMPIDTMALGGGIVSPGPDGHFDGFTYEIPGVILEDDR